MTKTKQETRRGHAYVIEDVEEKVEEKEEVKPKMKENRSNGIAKKIVTATTGVIVVAGVLKQLLSP